jgi:hypothetical protein
MKNPKVIWLAPACSCCGTIDREWCENDVWGECEECGEPSARYELVEPVTAEELEQSKDV